MSGRSGREGVKAQCAPLLSGRDRQDSVWDIELGCLLDISKGDDEGQGESSGEGSCNAEVQGRQDILYVRAIEDIGSHVTLAK